MVQPEDIYEPEWVEWFELTPEERCAESSKFWQFYLEAGGSLDPDPDPQSPLFLLGEVRASDGGTKSPRFLREEIRSLWRENMRRRTGR